MDNQWIFGIDGGGTSTRLRIESLEGKMLYQAESLSMNPRSVGWNGSRKTLDDLFSGMYKSINLSADNCISGFAGVAGIDREADTGMMRSIIREAGNLGFDTLIEVKNDSIPALAGAFGELRGILLIAGTGSIAVGADSVGRIIRSGGWGHILGDEGSAYWVGLRALNAAIRFQDTRGPQTDLLGRALAYFGEKEAVSLIPAIYEDFDKAKIAAFARIVAEEQDRGDETARQIFIEAAEELALLATSIAIRLGEATIGGKIAFSGGFITNNERLWRDTEARILSTLPRHRVVVPQADATTGACILARSIANQSRLY